MGGIPIATSRKRTLKKFIHENAVTLVAAGLLILILGTLLLSRYGDLNSIRDIANINPLITKGNAELIAVNVNGVIKIIKDDDQVASESDEKTENKKISSTATGSISNGSSTTTGSVSTSGGSASVGSTTPTNSGGGGATEGTSNGGGGNSGGNQSNGNGGTTTFKVSVSPLGSPTVGEAYDKVRVGGGLLGGGYTICKRNYTFTAQIKAISGSGKVNLSWILDGTTKDSVNNIELSQNQEKSFTYTVTVGSSGSHTFKASTPDSSQEKGFTHGC